MSENRHIFHLLTSEDLIALIITSQEKSMIMIFLKRLGIFEISLKTKKFSRVETHRCQRNKQQHHFEAIHFWFKCLDLISVKRLGYSPSCTISILQKYCFIIIFHLVHVFPNRCSMYTSHQDGRQQPQQCPEQQTFETIA